MSSTAAPSFLESRWLKRARLGPPDVYPQLPKQKEDELTSVNVKQGFNNSPFNEEYSSAHLYSIDVNKISQSFTSVLNQKQAVNTFNDAVKKRPQVTKENFVLVPVISSKPRNLLQMFFRELSTTKISHLLKLKVPVFSKKEDVFQTLADYEIPLVRATWFIKMTAAYHLTQTDAKMKKRTTNDPNSDWTQAICKFMREQLGKLNEDRKVSGSLTTHITSSVGSVGVGAVYYTGSSPTTVSREDFEKQLQYISNLAHHMYTEGLLDRHELLSWIVDEFESIPLFDEIALSYYMPFILRYVEDVVMNHLLARRLCFATAKHLNWLLIEGPNSQPASPSLLAGRNVPASALPSTSPNAMHNPVQSQLHCPSKLLPIAHTLSAAIQTTVVKCPGALVWYPPGDLKSFESPLDFLPCSPSALPLPEIDKKNSAEMEKDVNARKLLHGKEKEIIERSRAAEMRWSSDKCQESTAGFTMNKVLAALEALDKQNFDRIGAVDNLYHKIFEQAFGKDSDSQMPKAMEDAVVAMLCEWAITTKRLGEHRATVIAKLLDRRQLHHERTSTNQTNSSGTISQMESPVEAQNYDKANLSRRTPYFQKLLFMFLDTQAPELKDPDDAEQLQMFKNLIVLFSQLIEYDVFARDQYVSMLISHGDVITGQASSAAPLQSSTPHPPASVPGQSIVEGNTDVHNLDSSIDQAGSVKPEKVEFDFSRDSESIFSPSSRHDRHFMDAVRTIGSSSVGKHSSGASTSLGSCGSIWGYGHPRHVQYLMHFPIPFMDEKTNNEWNQRLMILYGAGRQKSSVKRAVKKVSKHLVKLIQNKRNIDDKTELSQPMSWGYASKKGKPSSGSSHDEFLADFRSLSYFDLNMVTMSASKTLLSSINHFITGRSLTLPALSVVTLLFDLMEEALNFHGTIQTAVSVCTNLPSLALAIQQKVKEGTISNSTYTWYSTELSLIIVAILRHSQSYLMLHSDMIVEVFDSLLNLSKQTCLSSPAQCTSADRTLLVFLNELHSASGSFLRAKYPEYSSHASNVRQLLCSTKVPATSNCRYDPILLRKYVEDPDKESALLVAEKHYTLLRDTTCRYSFVCTAIIAVCVRLQNIDKVYALANLCAEMTARCNDLCEEWLGVLKVLCCSSCNFNDVLLEVEASDPHIRKPLAIFTAVLIARSCLLLEDVIQHVAIPSLLAAFSEKQSAESNPDTGAHLTCHLLLNLFKSPYPASTKSSFHLPSSSDRRLLAVAQRNIALGAALAVLKAIIKLGDARSSNKKGKPGSDDDVSVTAFLAPIQDFNEFEVKMPRSSSEDSVGLHEFAKHAVKKICAQQWVQDRCIKYPSMELLMDQVLTKEQRKNLIQLICYPEEDLKRLSVLSGDPRNYVVGILSEITRWTLRQSSLELQVMLCENLQDKTLPEHIAKATIEVFQQQQMQQNMDSTRDRKSLTALDLDRCNVWLIAPLISKLPSQVQGRVLQEASSILEAPSNWSANSSRAVVGSRSERNDRKYGCSSLLNHQPFLTLILTCLKGQDEQRDSLLESLQSQIIMLQSEWQSARGQRDAGKDVTCFATSQSGVNDALQLRLSLVGGMFDTVQGNSQWTSDVVVLMTQLITSGMVDVQVNSELFNMVYDMVAVLLHHTLSGDGSKREYLNVVKKMKKEIGERQSESVRRLKRLLPMQRCDNYIVCCEPTGPLMDYKGVKIPAAADGSTGLQVASKQKLNPWEIIEGLKNPAPLCFAWFGARKLERKALYFEKEQALLRHHDHGYKRSLTELLKPPQLPPEEDEVGPPPAKADKSVKVAQASTPNVEVRRSNSKTGKSKPRSKRSSRVDPPYISRPMHPAPTMPNPSFNPTVPIGIPNAMGQPQSSLAMAPRNPAPYQQAYHPQTVNTNTIQPSAGYSAVHRPQSNPSRARNRLNEMLLLKKQTRTLNAAFGSGVRQSPVRQKLEGMMKPGGPLRSTHDVYQNRMHQPAMANQTANPSYQNYQFPKKATVMPGYNSGSMYRSGNQNTGQMGYQQQVNVATLQPSQQYVGNQQVMRTTNFPMQQGGAYGGQQQGIVDVQGQTQQAHYVVNQPGGRVMNNRIVTQQMTAHGMAGGQHLQQTSVIGQRQMMEQHTQMMSQQQQFGQMQAPQQGGMIEMRRGMMQQPPQYG